ncbi:hypothetical protein EV363DRAFT_927544 [Boletus edulis]|nr:hypothetical protein EV363DRAFT_927544 [Boletus edulis]
MASVCSGIVSVVGLIEIIGGLQLTSGGPSLSPSPDYVLNSVFSLSTLLNGFNVSMELLSSTPSTAQTSFVSIAQERVSAPANCPSIRLNVPSSPQHQSCHMTLLQVFVYRRFLWKTAKIQ